MNKIIQNEYCIKWGKQDRDEIYGGESKIIKKWETARVANNNKSNDLKLITYIKAVHTVYEMKLHCRMNLV